MEHLYRGRDHYETFVNEDVTIGSWLLGVSGDTRDQAFDRLSGGLISGRDLSFRWGKAGSIDAMSLTGPILFGGAITSFTTDFQVNA